jgi:hypothetical protein
MDFIKKNWLWLALGVGAYVVVKGKSGLKLW